MGRSDATEKPTQRRLHKAREQGQTPETRQLVGGMHWLVAAMALSWGVPAVAGWARNAFRNSLAATMLLTDANRNPALPDLQQGMAPLLGVAAVLVAVAASILALHLGANGGTISMARLSPKFDRLMGFMQLPSVLTRGAFSAGLGLASLPVLGGVAWMLLKSGDRPLAELAVVPLYLSASASWDWISSLLFRLAGALFVLGAAEHVWQRMKFQKGLRMTKQEVRDEHKEMEGNPEIKARVRRIQRSMAQRRMMREVPTATAVVVNPTHYAVAIRYDIDSMAAPLVVAKGKNYLALRIKAKAIENQVPIIENPPLARGLYQAAAVGQEIPPAFYRAMAEVLAYIFRITQGRARP